MSVDPFFGETLQKACHAVIAGTLNSEDLASPNLRSIFSLKVTLTGKHVNMSKSTDFIMSDYTNLPKVTDVEINGGNAGDGNIEF